MRVIKPGEKGPRKKKPPEPSFQPPYEPPQPPHKPPKPPRRTPQSPKISENPGLFAIAVVIVIIFLWVFGTNYDYHNTKGNDRPGSWLLSSLPEPLMNLSRGIAKVYATVAHEPEPVTTLPDHVMLCVPNTIWFDWKEPDPGSGAELFKQDAEDIARHVARKYTKPDMLYYQNKDHENMSGPEGGEWIMYAEKEKLIEYLNGNIIPMPVDLRLYKPNGKNLVCGETPGHEEGRLRYNGFAYTHKGEVIVWSGFGLY